MLRRKQTYYSISINLAFIRDALKSLVWLVTYVNNLNYYNSITYASNLYHNIIN